MLDESQESYGYGDTFLVDTHAIIDGVDYMGRVGTIVSVDWSKRWHVVALRFDDGNPAAEPIEFLRRDLVRATPPVEGCNG